MRRPLAGVSPVVDRKVSPSRRQDIPKAFQWYQRARNPMRLLQRELLAQACKGRHILDIGGGTGRTAAALGMLGHDVVVVDLDRERINFGKRSAQALFVRADGYRLPFAEATFDEVVLEEILEHLEDQKAFISEAYRVLRPDGRIILSTPNRWPFRIYVFFLRLATVNFRMLFEHVGSHIAEVNASELDILFAQFRKREIVGINPFAQGLAKRWPSFGIGLLGVFTK